MKHFAGLSGRVLAVQLDSPTAVSLAIQRGSLNPPVVHRLSWKVPHSEQLCHSRIEEMVLLRGMKTRKVLRFHSGWTKVDSRAPYWAVH